MGSETIGHEAEGNQLVGEKYRDKTSFNPFLPPKSRPFSLLVGYNI